MKKQSTRVALYLDEEALTKLDTYRAGLGHESRNAVIRAALRAFFQTKEMYKMQMQVISQ